MYACLRFFFQIQRIRDYELRDGYATLKVVDLFQQIEDLPPREYSTTRDPFVKLSLVKDTRRSLRKKTHLTLEEFTTKMVRHSLHPKFNETFTTEIKMSEFKVLILIKFHF